MSLDSDVTLEDVQRRPLLPADDGACKKHRDSFSGHCVALEKTFQLRMFIFAVLRR